MKNKNLVLLALAIGCGLVAAFLTAKLSAGNKTEMVPVLVAAKNLDQGTKLDEPDKLFVRKPFPKESVPPEFIDDISFLKGKVLQRTVRPGTHVTQDDITPRVELPLPIINGVPYRAMAIRVTQEKIAGGLVNPGSRVDVIVTERQQTGKAQATTILQQALVVSVNDVTRRPEEGSWKNATTVTLAVTGRQGMILALAQERGTLSLMLRAGDDKVVSKNGTSVSSFDEKGEDPTSQGTPATETAKVVVAKRAVQAGTKLENPEEAFEVRDFLGEMPENAYTNVEDLRGKTLTRDVFANNFVPKEAFEGVVSKPVDPSKPPETAKTDPIVKKDPEKTKSPEIHTMAIQVGTSAPQYTHFDKKTGRQLEGSGTGSAGIPGAPSTSGDSSAPIKPREKSEKSDEKAGDKPGKDD